VKLFAEANAKNAKYFAEKLFKDEILKLNSEIKGLREVNSILTDENERLKAIAAVKAEQDAKHDAALQELVDIAQEHDMGYGDKV